jgi:acyl carrier protein
MIGSYDNKFKTELKQMIIEACEKEVEIESIDDNLPMFGNGTALELDSLDALQLSMEIKKRYGVDLADSKEFRRVFTSINSLADYIRPN